MSFMRFHLLPWTYETIGERFELLDSFFIPPLMKIAELVVLSALVIERVSDFWSEESNENTSIDQEEEI